MARQQVAGLLDHLIGAHQYRRWDGDANRSRSLEIHGKLEYGWLFHRQIGGLGASENFIYIGGRSPETSRLIQSDCRV
jgi:hypothetical protein